MQTEFINWITGKLATGTVPELVRVLREDREGFKDFVITNLSSWIQEWKMPTPDPSALKGILVGQYEEVDDVAGKAEELVRHLENLYLTQVEAA